MSVPTRERLLAATSAVVAAEGYGAASVSRITARAGVAAGTLYRHFESKEAMFVELFRELCGREVEAMRRASLGAGSPLDRLEAAIETFARRALAEPRLAWALLAEPVDPAVDAERLEYRRRYRRLVAELLEEACEAGEIAESDNDVLAAAIIGGVGEALVGPLAGGAPPPDKLVADLRTFTRRAAGGGQ